MSFRLSTYINDRDTALESCVILSEIDAKYFEDMLKCLNEYKTSFYISALTRILGDSKIQFFQMKNINIGITSNDLLSFVSQIRKNLSDDYAFIKFFITQYPIQKKCILDEIWLDCDLPQVVRVFDKLYFRVASY